MWTYSKRRTISYLFQSGLECLHIPPFLFRKDFYASEIIYPFAEYSTGGECMIERLPESYGPVLAFRFTGEITDEDYREDFMPALRRAVKNFGLIRLFIDISDIQSEDMGAMDDDVREDARVVYVEREAVIGDRDWETRLNYVDHFFIFPNTDARFFPAGHQDEAWNWVSEGVEKRAFLRPAVQ